MTLSASLLDIKERYDVVVVGSGYGGAIAAARFARAGRRVAVLERGREFQPGDFPDTKFKALKEIQVDSPRLRLGSASNLYDFRVNNEINVFQGSGLGGTSLVNANVALRADPRVFDDPVWPSAFRADQEGLLAESYRRAEAMLRPVPYPDDQPPLLKLQALEKAAAAMKARVFRPPINVTFTEGVNHVGVWQSACKLCGDCVTGCNHTAKNTLATNYLPDAKNHGAEIFTEAEVRRLERSGDTWLVYFRPVGAGRETFDAPDLFVRSEIVVLGAGCLGSTEILLRSKAAGLPLSDRIGHRFSGNGDVLAFTYNSDQPIRGVGWGRRAPDSTRPVGPCISGVIDLRGTETLADGMVIQEGVIPGALATFVPSALSAAAALVGRDTDAGMADDAKEGTRTLGSLVGGAHRGAVRNTLTMLVMAHDDSGGVLRLENDRVRVDWPKVGEQPVFASADRHLESVARALGGTHLKNPIWSRILGHHLVTVHPLGGCPMGEDASTGAVNHQGQVFSGATGAEVYGNLLVCDGAVVPRSIGVNPLLTIAAIAERNVFRVANDHGWKISYDAKLAPAEEARSRQPGVRFTETMKGFFAKGIDDYADAWARGKQDGSPLEFTLTIAADDLGAMLRDEHHRAKLIGTVTAPHLSPFALTATGGEFRLFSRSDATAQTHDEGRLWMHYRMRLSSREGRHYFLEGHKRICDDRGLDLWADTTTLFFTVHDGHDPSGPVVGRGILRIRLLDFVRQMTTFKILGARNIVASAWWSLQFNWFFARNLLAVFGGPFVRRLLAARAG